MILVRLTVNHSNLTEMQADALIVNLFQGVTTPAGATGAIDTITNGAISRLLEQGEFVGKLNETAVLYPSELRAGKIVVVGLGEQDKLTYERIRQAAATALKIASKGKVKTVGTIVHGAGIGGLCPAACAQAVAEGSLLAMYRYTEMKSKQEEREPVQVIIAENDEGKMAFIEQGVEAGIAMAEATNLARTLVNAPGNFMTPTHMAEAAAKIATELGLECTILEKDDMEQLGMGCLLGVAKGSIQPPKMIVLKHNGNPGGETIAFVGKGLTFDSGGISLKAGAGMHNMKNDMGGGAAVLGAMYAIGKLKPKANILAVIPCTENMPSGGALKPGDVLRGMAGKTIEIISTDAEGRLILADGVAYAESQGATKIVDIATLTGAVGAALGKVQAGIVSDSDSLVEAVQAAAEIAGERYWRFPHDDDYKEFYKSDIADMKNSGGASGGGTITGGLIIREFIGKAAWVHLDIAAMVITESEKGYNVKGATGFGARTLANLAKVLAE